MAEVWQAGAVMPTRTGVWPTVLRAPFAKRTWLCVAYLIINAPLAVGGFAFVVSWLSAGAFLAVTFVGLPLIALTVLIARRLGALHRRLARAMVRVRVEDPPRFRSRPGVLGWLGSALGDVTGWRAIAYLLVKFPIGVAGLFVTAMVWLYALGTLTYPVWWALFDPRNPDSHGIVHHSGMQFGNFYFDTWPRALLASAMGVVVLFVAPWPTRGVAALDGLVIRWLLGPTRAADRMRELQETRAHAVDDQAAALRRIERDLHDGTQARLVALAMNVGLAKEKLGAADPSAAQRLLDDAHRTAKDAIAELRTLVRGIHPPVLDNGLDAALATLAANSAIPVELRTHLPHRPAAAIETIAYFCAAELLTNAAKHSSARQVWLDARMHGALLRLSVRDDGHGGARVGAGTGLTGLAERVRTVDGRLVVDSPIGGPTTITVELPEHA